MGVIPMRFGHSSSQRTADCRLCADIRAPGSDLASAIRDLPHIVPVVLTAIVGLLVAAFDRGAPGWLGGGLAAGVVACAFYAWAGRGRLLRTAHEAHAKELAALEEDADARVQLVIKQFEWAVGDFTTVRSKLDAAEASVRSLSERVRERGHRNEQLVRQISRLRERLAEIAMTASLHQAGKETPAPHPFEAIYFTWGLHLDGARARLELQTAANNESPTRVRVMDRDGQIVAVSSTAVVSLDGNLEFQLEPPLDLVADLDAGLEINYAIEALVDDEWKPVRLKDTGRRTMSVVDVQGRLSRVPDIREVVGQVESGNARRSALN